MCGIAGNISFNHQPPDPLRMEGMLHVMRHRGPNDSGVWQEGRLTLGFVRLSIIDLSPLGHQPMVSDDERYVIVFNGEVYNYIEIREELRRKGYSFRSQTDTEVILQAYRAWGPDALDRFNGMWALAIYDRQQKELFCSRDRYGIKPFYYCQSENGFAFASEIAPLLTLLPGKPTANEQAIYEFLVYNRTDQDDHSFFKEVRKLPHGHNLKIDLNCGEVVITRWYRLQERLQQAQPITNGAQFLDLFRSAVGLRLRADVPVGVCLSGGLDSSAISSVLLNCFHKSDLHSFSAVYTKGETGDESEFIDEFEGLIQHRHFITPTAESLFHDLDRFTCTHAEPVPTTSIYAHFKVMELASRHVVVTLDGQGADEELAGYPYFFGFYYKELLHKWKFFLLLSEMLQYTRHHKSLYALKSLAYFLLPARWQTQMRIRDNGCFTAAFREQRFDSVIPNKLYQSGDLQTALFHHFEYKLEHLLKWVDLNSMHFSLESRVPFLDFRLVEGLLTAPSDRLIRRGTTKQLLREGLEGIMPERIRTRKDKVGFETPQKDWFRTPAFSGLIHEVLQSDSFRKRKIIDPEKAIGVYQRHADGKVEASREIWKWINLELWFRKYIDG